MGKLQVFCGSGLETLKLDGMHVKNRHGASHSIAPKDVEYRANVKEALDNGATHVLIICASGILKETNGRGEDVTARIGDIRLVEDFIDITPHEGFHDDKPFDPQLHHSDFTAPLDKKFAGILKSFPEISRHGGIIWHWEGNRFQTPSEVNFMSTFANLVNMTAAKEIEMAHEAGLTVACIAIGTDKVYCPEMKGISAAMQEARPHVIEIIKKASSWVMKQ